MQVARRTPNPNIARGADLPHHRGQPRRVAQGVRVLPDVHEPDDDAGFTLDPSQLADRRAAGARRMHTMQMPIVRTVGFVILCVLIVLDDWRTGVPLASRSCVGWSPAICCTRR